MPAKPGHHGPLQDFDAAAALLQTVMPSQCARLTPYGSPQFGRFLLAAQAVPPEHRTLLLRSTGSHDQPAAPVNPGGSDRQPVSAPLQAVADWRLLGQVLFLNGLAVDPSARGRGLGHALLADGLQLANQAGCHSVELDVAEDNPRARSLYERFGFQPIRSATWAEVTVHHHGGETGELNGPFSCRQVGDRGAWRVRNWPAFRCHVDTYGFADLDLTGSLGNTSIRVLPGGWRIGDPRLAESLVSTLAGVVPPPERVFVVRDGHPANLEDGLVPLATFHRMRLASSPR